MSRRPPRPPRDRAPAAAEGYKRQLLFLLASASANTALFAANYTWLLAINGVAALALLVLVGLQLRRLRRDFKDGVFGSRLKSRLLLMLSWMAVLPGALV